MKQMTNKNPAHYCFNGCGKYLGFRGWCSKKCHNEFYDNFVTKPNKALKKAIGKGLEV